MNTTATFLQTLPETLKQLSERDLDQVLVSVGYELKVRGGQLPELLARHVDHFVRFRCGERLERVSHAYLRAPRVGVDHGDLESS